MDESSRAGLVGSFSFHGAFDGRIVGDVRASVKISCCGTSKWDTPHVFVPATCTCVVGLMRVHCNIFALTFLCFWHGQSSDILSAEAYSCIVLG